MTTGKLRNSVDIDAPGSTAGYGYKSYPSRSAEAFNPKAMALRFEGSPTVAVRTSYPLDLPRTIGQSELYRTESGSRSTDLGGQP